MPGFRPEATIYTLKFEGGPNEGLVVKVGACTIAEFNNMLRLQSSTGTEVADNNDKVIEMFLSKLIDWNLENQVNGVWQPTPQTMDGVSVHEKPLISEILKQWQMAMAGVTDELGKDSTSGDNSLERSLGLG